MTFHFKPAVRENVNLLIGIAGPSGSGKTYSSMRLASGISGDEPFAVIDTEAGRACHYAGTFNFHAGELNAPFRPDAYAEAITVADKAGYRVIVVDQMSSEHAGEGGLLDWHEEEVTRLAGDDWKKREAVNMLAWAKVKTSHKRMMNKLLTVRAHLILCFRAEAKIEIVREDGKTKIVPKQSVTGLDGYIPICEKTLPYELTASFLMTPDRPGFPLPIKLQEAHRAFFPLDRPITEECGRAIAQWAAGGSEPAPPSMPENRVVDALTDLEETDELDALRTKLTRYRRACRAAGDPAAHKRLSAAAAERAKTLKERNQSRP